MYNVLFVCTGNICRSPMALGFLNAALEGKVKNAVVVKSASTYGLNGEKASENAIKVMKMYDIDLSMHRSTPLQKNLLKEADLIVAMDRSHLDAIESLQGNVHRTKLLGEFNKVLDSEEIMDPYGASMDIYEECAKSIKGCIPGLLEYIRNAL